jgi:hypothetical protein
MNKAKYCMNKLGHSNNKKKKKKVKVLEFCDIQRLSLQIILCQEKLTELW